MNDLRSHKLDTNIKDRMRATWEDGDYAHFASYMEAGAKEILHDWNIAADSKMLDVGCGSGQTAIPAAKQGIRVTGVDIAANLIDFASARANELALEIDFRQGDAEHLPFADNEFDVVTSLIGAMFAPDPTKVVAEFSRVLKPGGKLYMSNWTTDSGPAEMFRAVSKVTPPPKGLVSPVLWGNEDTVLERLQRDFIVTRMVRKSYPLWHYPFSTTELVQLFRKYFGPVKRAFDFLESQQDVSYRDEAIQLFHNQLESVWKRNSVYENDILTITGGHYLQIDAVKR